MTLLKNYSFLQKAYIDKGMLESNGIPVVVQTDALSQLFPGSSLAGSIGLYVPEEDVEKAWRLLDESK